MTAIVALVRGDRVHMGADSAIVAGDSRVTSADQPRKILRRSGWLIGWAGDLTIARELASAPLPAPRCDSGDGRRLTEALRRAFADRDYSGQWEALAATRGGWLWSLDCHGTWERSTAHIATAGDGGDVALGYLTATADARRAPAAILRGALAAAERWTPHVRRPFRVASI